jgi:hypothetical protein
MVSSAATLESHRECQIIGLVSCKCDAASLSTAPFSFGATSPRIHSVQQWRVVDAHSVGERSGTMASSVWIARGTAKASHVSGVMDKVGTRAVLPGSLSHRHQHVGSHVPQCLVIASKISFDKQSLQKSPHTSWIFI